ncbi:MAG TPA: nuclear transport factor 2 family protein [Candidatus Acidoferrales bacterium]|nr:nuclear transport factor 2 family protein [Candidatus Acidoferrales bacterium]
MNHAHRTSAKRLTVADRIAINDLMAQYAWALDTGDVDRLVACFTANAVVIEEVFEEPDRWEGRDNIRRFAEHFRHVPNFPGRQHHLSQLIVKGNSKRCSARSFVFVTECQGEPPYTLRFTGYYDDQLVKVGSRWLFRERVIRLWDGEVLALFPGRGQRTPRQRPPELVIRKG